MWLLKKLTPDHKTIAEFGRLNGKGLKDVFRDFVDMCRSLDLVGWQIVAVDGSKFSASNSKACNFTRKKLEKKLKRLEKVMEDYLSGWTATTGTCYHNLCARPGAQGGTEQGSSHC